MASVAARRKTYSTPGVINGSLAYDFDALERQLDSTGRMGSDFYAPPMEETAADVIARAHESAKAKVRPAQHISPVILLGFAAVAAMMVMMVMCYVELTNISNRVVSMRQEVETLETQQVTLMTKYEQAFDLTSVKEAALAAGMSLPSDSQIYYIDLSDPDNAQVYAQESGGLKAALEKAEEGIGAVVEYFR